MENGKWKSENEPRAARETRAVTGSFSLDRLCTACGATRRRGNAKFCCVCGKRLSEDYEPLDTIRASYRLQNKSFDFGAALAPPPAEIIDLFEQNKNSVSQTAWACVVYSMVPYLGILFVPLAFVIGGCGYFVAVRKPALGGRRLALVSFGLSLVVLLVQVFLWWLLYIIPELGVPV